MTRCGGVFYIDRRNCLVPGARGKLSPRYAGPFQVVARVGDVAYKLQLPDGARIHDVFHVGYVSHFMGMAGFCKFLNACGRCNSVAVLGTFCCNRQAC